MAEREKYEPDINKIQKGVEEEAHNMELLKQRNRQLEHLGLEQHHRHMQAITKDPQKESIIGVPLDMTRKPDEQWHEEKRPARARTVEDIGPRMETNVTPSQGMTGSKHGLRGYFGTAVGDQPEVPHGIKGLDELARLNLVDVEEPTETGMTRRPSPKETAPEETERRDIGERKPTDTSVPQMETPTAAPPVPGTLLREQMGDVKQGDWGKKAVPQPSASTVHRARPLVSNIEEKTPQIEPVPHLVQATRPLPEWKQGEMEGEPKLTKRGKPEQQQVGQPKDTGVGVRLGTGMGHGGIQTQQAQHVEQKQGKIADTEPKPGTGGKKESESPLRAQKPGKMAGAEPTLEKGGKPEQQAERPLYGQKQGKIAGTEPKPETGGKKESESLLRAQKPGKVAGAEPKFEKGGKPVQQQAGISKDTGVGVRLGTGMGHGGIRPQQTTTETEGLQKKPLETGTKQQQTQPGLKPKAATTWQEQAEGQSSGWQGGVCPGLEKGTTRMEQGTTRQTDESLWKQQAMGQSSEWQGGVCPHTGPAKTPSDKDKGTTSRATNIPTTLERDVGEGRAGRLPAESSAAWPVSTLDAPGVGAESMHAAVGLPGAPPEWEGEGRGKVEPVEGAKKQVKEEMGMGKVQSEEQQPELVGHREQELGGRTQLLQQ